MAKKCNFCDFFFKKKILQFNPKKIFFDFKSLPPSPRGAPGVLPGLLVPSGKSPRSLRNVSKIKNGQKVKFLWLFFKKKILQFNPKKIFFDFKSLPPSPRGAPGVLPGLLVPSGKSPRGLRNVSKIKNGQKV